MPISFRLTAGLIVASPILMWWDSPLIRALLTAYVAVAVACIALTLRPGEGGYLATVFRPFAIVASIPVAWMLVQIVPLPFGVLLNPVWLSARDALDDTTLGSISIDPGATLVALSHFAAVIGIILMAAAVTIDRQRAEWTLILLAAVTSIVAVLTAAHDLAGFRFLGEFDGAGPRASAQAISALGVMTTAAASIWAIERFETRRASADMSYFKFIRSLALCLAGLAICWLAVFFFAARGLVFATACGFGTLIWILAVRRVGLGPWLRAAIAIAGIGAAALVVLGQWGSENVSFSLRFATIPSSLLMMAQRMLSDASWTGSGAGSFAALIPIYRGGEDVGINGTAPTLAANLAIELGWPAVWGGVLIMIFVCARLLRGAFQRGRDSFYVTAAAGAAVLLTVEAFCDASLTGVAPAIIAASLLGLGIAQSTSRTLQ